MSTHPMLSEPVPDWTVPRLATKWQCSRKHIYELIREGKLASYCIGARNGIRVTDAERQRYETASCDERASKPATPTPALPSASETTAKRSPTTAMLKALATG